MSSSEKDGGSRTRMVRELGRMLRRQASGRWTAVRVARRRQRGHQVWRFRPDAEAGDRFLHVANDAFDRTTGSSRALFQQLRAGRWLSRLDEGGETALRLGADGRVEAYSAAE